MSARFFGARAPARAAQRSAARTASLALQHLRCDSIVHTGNVPHAAIPPPPPPLGSLTFSTLSLPPPCLDGRPPQRPEHSRESILDIARSRTGWLCAFCVGLLLAALVVEQYEDVLEHHVELSFFVPLIMGHGGNTGSQAVTTVIRALALRQITSRDAARVVAKEAGAGCLMGAVLGLAILGFSCVWSGISPQVGSAVAVALPVRGGGERFFCVLWGACS